MDKETRPYPSQAYSWYVVCVLLAAYILAFVDREIINLLVPDIKASLGINDPQNRPLNCHQPCWRVSITYSPYS